ncbi:MAG: S9 family peptidase [Pseudomonadota bacterium]
MFRKFFHRALAAGVLAMAVPVAANAQTPEPVLATPTAADFGALPILSDPKLAPDGKHIAARGQVQGKTMVLVIDISTPGNTISKLGLPDKHQLEWLRWAGNDRILVSLSRLDWVVDDEVRITRLVSLDLKTGKQTMVGPRDQGIDGDDLVYVDPAGKFALLSTQPSIFEYPSVYRVDLATGRSEPVLRARDDVWDWYADSTGTVRVGVGARNGRWWMLYRSNATGDFKRLVRREGDKDDKGIQQFMPVAGSDQGYAVADGKSGHFALYRYDFAADTLGELLYENPNVDVDDFTVARTGELLGVYYTEDRARILWFDSDLKRLQARIDRVLPGTTNRIVSTSEDKNRLLIWAGSATDPGAYFVYDRTANVMSAFAQTHPALVDKRLSAMEPVRYQARDGLEIPGYLTLPAGRPAKDLPLIVMPHGGPFARDEWGYDPWVQYLASRGYAVLQPNFRGSTGFGRKFVESGTGAWGRGMQDDIDDGVKWLAAKGTIDAKRVCIMGASFGGYAAMWAAVRNPELYRCAISFAGISDVDRMLRYDRKSFSAPRYFRNWRERVQGDKRFELDQISPIKSVEKLTVPILIAHGADDDNVPVSQSRRLHEALLKLGRPHEYVVYPNEGHGFKDPVHSTDFLNRVGAFLDKYNPS